MEQIHITESVPFFVVRVACALWVQPGFLFLVGLASVGNFEHKYDEMGVLDVVDDSAVPYSCTHSTISAFEFDSSARSRVCGELFYCVQDCLCG